MLQYRDQPGDFTHDHDRPDSVMVTLSGFRRSINAGGKAVEVDMPRTKPVGSMPKRTAAKTLGNRKLT
ncbi:hypothetical protein GCM10027027_22550 [Neomicrococcus lactis]